MTTTTKANNNNFSKYALSSTSEMFRLVHAKACGAYNLAGCEEWAKVINALQYEYRAFKGFPVVTSVSFPELDKVDIEFSILALPAVTYGEIGSNLLQLLPIYAAALKAMPIELIGSIANSIEGRSFTHERDQALEELMEAIPMVNWVDSQGLVLAEYHYETSLRSDLPSDIQLRVTRQLSLAARIFNLAGFSWYATAIEKRVASAFTEFSVTTQIPPELHATVIKFASRTRVVSEYFGIVEDALRNLKKEVQEAERALQATPKERKPKTPVLTQLSDDVIANLASLLD